jgi:hypothetical protein
MVMVLDDELKQALIELGMDEDDFFIEAEVSDEELIAFKKGGTVSHIKSRIDNARNNVVKRAKENIKEQEYKRRRFAFSGFSPV